jgi:hypothetical protein
MKIRIVVDANIIISAFLGGKPRFLLFEAKNKLTKNRRFDLIEKGTGYVGPATRAKINQLLGY